MSRRTVNPAPLLPAADRGQATPLIAVVAVLVALVAAALAHGGSRLIDAQRAQTAADAAALAGTTGGQVAAQRLAARNGAVLVSFTERGDEVRVVVAVDGHTAVARASDGPEP